MPPFSTYSGTRCSFSSTISCRAIASIKTELTTVQRDVAALIKQMESSIAEAEQFIRQMQKLNKRGALIIADMPLFVTKNRTHC